MARPRPVPPSPRRAAGVDAIESLEDSPEMFGGDSASRVGHGHRRAARSGRFGADGHRPARRVPNRVLDEVAKDLPERGRIGVDAPRASVGA